ncbi:MAG: hypothetical protein WC322_02125 [Candidatus Paceibacterota bacterium]|jgi:hypothetical protein|nr:hypothetical protein [Candidatus Paceibacterota bacterium]
MDKISQKKLDEMVKDALEAKRYDFAKNLLSLGDASKDIAKKTLFAVLSEKIEKVKKLKKGEKLINVFDLRSEISAIFKLIDQYHIECVEKADEAAYIFMERELFYPALSFATYGSEEAKERVVKESLEKENGESVFEIMEGIRDHKKIYVPIVAKVLSELSSK